MRLRKYKGSRRVTIDDWRIFLGNHWQLEKYLELVDAEELERPTIGTGCWRCGRERKHHITWHTDGNGISPLCEVCWEELGTPEHRMPWYRSMWLSWDIGRKYSGCPYGNHTYGLPPFEIGHDHPTWDMIETIVNNEV